MWVGLGQRTQPSSQIRAEIKLYMSAYRLRGHMLAVSQQVNQVQVGYLRGDSLEGNNMQWTLRSSQQYWRFGQFSMPLFFGSFCEGTCMHKFTRNERLRLTLRTQTPWHTPMTVLCFQCAIYCWACMSIGSTAFLGCANALLFLMSTPPHHNFPQLLPNTVMRITLRISTYFVVVLCFF